jgi:hypothetical protein
MWSCCGYSGRGRSAGAGETSARLGVAVADLSPRIYPCTCESDVQGILVQGNKLQFQGLEIHQEQMDGQSWRFRVKATLLLPGDEKHPSTAQASFLLQTLPATTLDQWGEWFLATLRERLL